MPVHYTHFNLPYICNYITSLPFPLKFQIKTTPGESQTHSALVPDFSQSEDDSNETVNAPVC